MNQARSVEHSYTAELVRKGIHLCSLSIPIIYLHITQAAALTILIPLTLVFVVVDILRYYHPPTRRLFHALFAWLLRSHELDHNRKRLNGASYVLISATLCIVIFPKVIVVTAFAILIVSDTLAALVGRKFGTQPFLGKSMQGAVAFFLSAVGVVILAPKVAELPAEYLIGFVGAVVGTIVESVSISIDDNLTIPLAVGATMWLLYVIFLPDVNIVALDS